MRRNFLAGSAATAALALMAPEAAAQPSPLNVIASGALEHVLRELAAALIAAGGPPVAFVIGNAGDVSRRIRAGEPADLIINTAAEVEAVARDGLVDGATRALIGTSRLGLGVGANAPLPDIATPEALRATLLAAPTVAVPDPQAGGAAGLHLQRMFEQLDVAEALRPPRVQYYRQGRLGTQAVAEGRAALAMTQISEIVAVSGVVLVGPLPEAVQLLTPYVGAVAARAQNRDGALLLLRQLTGPDAAARLRAVGFTPGG